MSIPGPIASEQLQRFAREWKQGEHVLISGSTGSGKSLLGRFIDQVRIDKGGHVVVFVAKMSPDETILKHYKGWTRWEKWHKRPSPYDNRILLWPKVEKTKTLREARDLQVDVFGDAINQIHKTGKWCVDFDEGLYMCSPRFMGMADDIALLHQQGRSNKISIVTKLQRPAHAPLEIYSSASHAFVGRAREQADSKRLSELGGKDSAKTLQARISGVGQHDFLWIPVAPDWDPEVINLER